MHYPEMKRAFSSLSFLLKILTFEFWVLNVVLVYGEDTHVLTTASTNETMKDPICPTCNHESCDWVECYKNFVIFKCLPSFEKSLTDYNNHERCTWDTIKRSYTEFTMCTELYADSLRVPWPNQLVEDTFVWIHAKYFQDCLVTELYDPPPSIIFVLVMTPICLIPVMVTLVVLKTKNGDSTS